MLPISEGLHVKTYTPDSYERAYRGLALVLANEWASPLSVPDGNGGEQEGDFGRLARNTANQLGIVVCAHERIGSTEETFDSALCDALQPGEPYKGTIQETGRLLCEIIAEKHPETRAVVLAGKSGGSKQAIDLAAYTNNDSLPLPITDVITMDPMRRSFPHILIGGGILVAIA